jgi:tripartite-type tricarboxylate transporter receptor subunit TctC
MNRRRFLSVGSRWAALIYASCAALVGTAAHAQSFPSRALRIIVPYAPGGTSDILARTLAVRVGEAIGQQVLIENKPGANGVLGSDLVAKSAADGYTLLLTDVGSLTSAPAIVSNLPFNPLRDFAPVTMIAYSPHLVVVPATLPVQTLAELVALAKSKAGALNVATVGSGSAPHLAAAMFAKRAGIQWSYVPYKGGAQALNDVASGQAEVLFNGMLATAPVVRSGRLRALAISSEKRWASLPELATVSEQGYDGFLTGSWQGLLAAPGTPADIIAKLNHEFVKALAIPEVSERLTAQGAEPRPMKPEQFAEFLKTETAKWALLVKEAGIKAE